MEDKERSKGTLGQAIDTIITALSELPEPSRQIAVSAACEAVGLKAPDGKITPSVVLPQTGPKGETAVAASSDIKSLKENKRPTSNSEMAALVAYYLQELVHESERRSEITTDDIEKYFKQAQYELPASIPDVLRRAKDAGYLDSVRWGRYRLNPVGYNLVVHRLPHAGQSAAETPLKPPRRRHSKPGLKRNKKTPGRSPRTKRA
jgi:hypothetical protein